MKYQGKLWAPLMCGVKYIILLNNIFSDQLEQFVLRTTSHGRFVASLLGLHA